MTRTPLRPRAIWLPLAGVCALAGMLGAAQGVRVAAGGETAAIGAAVARYLAEAGPGAQATDCAARPEPGFLAWIALTCAAAQGTMAYRVNRMGWVARAPDRFRGPET